MLSATETSHLVLEYPILPRSSRAEACPSGHPSARPQSPMPRSYRCLFVKEIAHWKNDQSEDRQTMAASPSLEPPTSSLPPRDAFLHTTTWKTAPLRPADGNSGNVSEES